MLAGPKYTADATEDQWRAQERGAKRHPAGVVVLAGARARSIEVNRLERAVSAGERQPRTEDLVDDDGAVGLL